MSALESRPGDGGEVGFQTLYARLRAICGRKLLDERVEHTLQATALANEVWMRLYELDPVAACNPSRATRWFVANAVIAVRQVLVDHARTRKRQKRGGGFRRVELGDGDGSIAEGLEDRRGSRDLGVVEQILRLNELLGELARVSPLQAEIVSLRYFGGLSFAQVAAILELSESGARREWALARVWLGSQAGVDRGFP
jgi:RNA polymerase sigma factor (TIGR02999 family)